MKNNSTNTMNKFKVGDRVRVVARTDGATPTASTKRNLGKEFVIGQVNNGWLGTTDHYWYNESGRGGFDTWEGNLELVTDYQPITPKVGDKFRVIKQYDGAKSIKVGSVIVLSGNDGGNVPYSWEYTDGRHAGWTKSVFCTTEYLEPIEQGTEIRSGTTIQIAKEWRKGEGYNWGNAPIKQTIIKKTMNALKKLTQSKDDKALEKAGYIDSCGEPTSKTRDILIALLFTEKKAELVKMAEAEIAEGE